MCRTVHFNPRPPVRGATSTLPEGSRWAKISIHAPLCGGRRYARYLCHLDNPISIHAPLCGGRQAITAKQMVPIIFQSTPPCAGGDPAGNHEKIRIVHFNPRPPVRGATKLVCSEIKYKAFQSTPPCAGGDTKYQREQNICTISIHAPLRGGRPQDRRTYGVKTTHFNPRPPARGATSAGTLDGCKRLHFNPRPPVRGATRV